MPIQYPNCELCGEETIERWFEQDCKIMVCREYLDHLASADRFLSEQGFGPCLNNTRQT